MGADNSPMPDLLDFLPKRYREAAARMARRRLARYDRGLPMDLTEPITPEQAASPLIPYETVATGPRPASAMVASVLLVMLGGVMAAIGVTTLGVPVASLVGEPAVDGMTKLVQLIVAAFLGGILLLLLLFAAAHFYAAWRIWQGINWGWVEGSAVSVIGGAFAILTLGLADGGRFQISSTLLLVVGGYAGAVGAIQACRSWLGPVRFPMNREKAPWWMRIADRWR
jgi:hypothetical protein